MKIEISNWDYATIILMVSKKREYSKLMLEKDFVRQDAELIEYWQHDLAKCEELLEKFNHN